MICSICKHYFDFPDEWGYRSGFCNHDKAPQNCTIKPIIFNEDQVPDWCPLKLEKIMNRDRIKKNTCELEIGTIFYLAENAEIKHKIVAQGPLHFGYESRVAFDANCHQDVWVEIPRTKLSQFDVGDKFRFPIKVQNCVFETTTVGEKYFLKVQNCVFEITAVGEKYLLAKDLNAEEFVFALTEEVEDVIEEEDGN